MPPKQVQPSPLFIAEDSDEIDASLIKPGDDELNECDYVDVEEKEWTDGELMDDARPGRR
jgi:hypothetical protein